MIYDDDDDDVSPKIKNFLEFPGKLSVTLRTWAAAFLLFLQLCICVDCYPASLQKLIRTH